MKKTAAVLAALGLAVALSACDNYSRTRNPDHGPSVPEGCVVLYKHHEGDDQSADKYDGVYCKVETKVETP